MSASLTRFHVLTTHYQHPRAVMTATRITHLIAGEPWSGSAERTSPVFNAATGEQSGVLNLASAELVGKVVVKAKRVWSREWGTPSLARPGKVVTSRWLDPSHGGLNLGFPQNDR